MTLTTKTKRRDISDLIKLMTIMDILCTVFQVDLFSQVNILTMVFEAMFFLCLYASGQKLALRLKSDLLVFPHHQIKINQENNENILWATSSTYNCNLLVCSLHLSGAPFLYKALINEHTFLVSGLLLLSSEIQQTPLLKWHSALQTHEGKVSFFKKIIHHWVSSNAD